MVVESLFIRKYYWGALIIAMIIPDEGKIPGIAMVEFVLEEKNEA